MAANVSPPEVLSNSSAGGSFSKKRGKLTITVDEMWSFVGAKANKKWMGLAMDEATREMVGLDLGRRSRAGAVGLWQSLPAVYSTTHTR
ncbi:MAG: hypothetical protein BRC49_07010 [Cyanobacteria bacterium SW_10_48_33]|nr:MAG: hypothetical protein BRC49_07010 [Cyanobacteria bacterium SW_10_48_33]